MRTDGENTPKILKFVHMNLLCYFMNFKKNPNLLTVLRETKFFLSHAQKKLIGLTTMRDKTDSLFSVFLMSITYSCINQSTNSASCSSLHFTYHQFLFYF